MVGEIQKQTLLRTTSAALQRTGGAVARTGGALERTGVTLQRAGDAKVRSRHVFTLEPTAAHTAGPLIF